MKPDFLGIGAPRSATSWLHRQLAAHPALWLPPVKELHFWDVQREASRAHYPVPGADPAAIARGFRRDHRRLLVRELLRRARKRRLARGEVRWALRYLTLRGRGGGSDAWYASLFPEDRIAGEITPAYMMLARPVVEAVARSRPALRAILLLRDPVDRVWSGSRRFALSGDAGAGGGLGDEERRRALAHFDSPGVRLRTDYLGALRVWRGVLGAERVFVGFYDEVAEKPADLLARILRFVGADPAHAGYAPDVERRVNTAPPLAIPPELAAPLASRFLEPLAELADEFGEYPARWRERALRLAAAT